MTAARDDDHDLKAYDFDLPSELIAQEPAQERTQSRLLHLPRHAGARGHHVFAELPRLLNPGDLLVMNRTRVIPARLAGKRVATGGKLELLLQPPGPGGELGGLVRSGGKLRSGELLEFADGALILELIDTESRGRRSFRRREDLDGGRPLEEVCEEAGRMPLPPYIRRDDDRHEALDRERYQTVIADRGGAVAAPTAGLHFDERLLEELATMGVGLARLELTVGLGTFAPIEVTDIREHRMHSERYEVSQEVADAVNETRRQKGRVIAVGTTSVRSLESAWDEESGRVLARRDETSIYIHPGRELRAIDGLITNFHLPQSSLILLVAAFVGRERILETYREAVSMRYRFFSYGDAMLIL
jgi:S-adenosylmethionine:tRNA ribosyltransferase-isomerase